MNGFKRFLFLLGSSCIAASTVSAWMALAQEQQGAPPPGAAGTRRAGPPGRGNTREFLGLGKAPDAAAAARGEKLYGPACAFCHGTQATGAEGPNLVRSEVVLHDEKGELVGPVLLKGRPDHGMPAFPNLTPDQVYDISEFLHMRVELVANRGTYKRLNVVTGDAKKGEAYFNGAGQCATCHAVTGDFAKIGAKFTEPDQLQTRFVYPASRGPRQAKVTLKSGETISGTIKRIDDFSISLVDGKGTYHYWPRADVKIEIPDPLAAHRELAAKYTDDDMHNLTAYLVTLK